MVAPNPIPMTVRRARWAVATLFWLNGATLASVVPRFPLVKENLGLSNAFFGLALAVGPFGALVAGLWTASFMRRFGSARVATWAQVAQIVLAGLVLNTPLAWLFPVLVFAMSATDAYTDIAMNAHGLRVQRLYGRSINNGFHAWWSVGGVCGGAVGAFFAGINLPLWLHAVGFGAVLLAINLTLRRFLLSGPDADEPADETAPTPRIPANLWLTLVLLGLVGAFAATIEDFGFNWSALYLSEYLGAMPAIAGLGVVAVLGAQTIGRFTGDHLVDAVGNRTAARIGALVGLAGMTLALVFPSLVTTFIGFAAAGWGVATIIPGVYATADALPGAPAGSGLAIVNWVLRLSFIISPPLVGMLADTVSFRAALFVVPLSLAAVVVLAGRLRGRDQRLDGGEELGL